MSVSQVKKRFGEFASYLKNDKEGLRRLKLLKDDVNVLRTNFSAAETKAEIAVDTKKAAIERADKAENKFEALKIEADSLRQKVSSLMKSLDDATKSDNEPIDKVYPEHLVELRHHVECKRVLKKLRRTLPQCPHAHGRMQRDVIIRQSLAEGWSHHDIWTIGASVAVLAAHNGRVTVVDKIGVIFSDEDSNLPDGLAFNFIRWYGEENAIRDFGVSKFSNKSLEPDKQYEAEMTSEFFRQD